MPDWIGHILAGLILAELFKIKPKSLVILGALLPDILTKFYLISILIPIDRYLIKSYLMPLHTPIGVALFALLLIPLFNLKPIKTYLLLAIGWSSHLLLDLTNRHLIYGENHLLFPFYWGKIEFGWLWPNQYYIAILILLTIYLLIKIINHNKTPTPMIRRLICHIGSFFFLFKKTELKDTKINKILIIRSAALGDVLMTTPFIKNLRNNFPKAQIDYLTGNWSKPVLKNNKNLDNIISYNDNIIVKKQPLQLFKLIKKIRKNNYDLAFILDKCYLWNLLALTLKTKFRVGFDRTGEGFPNNISIPFNGTKYELDYNLDLLKKLNLTTKYKEMEIFTIKKDSDAAKNLLLNIKGPYIGIAPGAAKNPGSELSSKRWSKENYTILIKLLLKNNYKIILFGGPGDKDIGEFIENTTNNKNLINLIGKTNIQETYTIMKRCKLIITHDSGPLHIAQIATKTLALFGPTPPFRFANKNTPVIYKGNKERPCYDIYGHTKKNNLMEQITVKEVYNKSIKLLK